MSAIALTSMVVGGPLHALSLGNKDRLHRRLQGQYGILLQRTSHNSNSKPGTN